jgi:hypothetical protein
MVVNYLAQLHHGHLEALFHIFVNLWTHKWSKLVFDDMCMNWGNDFQDVDWADFLPPTQRTFLPHVPKPYVVSVYN